MLRRQYVNIFLSLEKGLTGFLALEFYNIYGKRILKFSKKSGLLIGQKSTLLNFHDTLNLCQKLSLNRIWKTALSLRQRQSNPILTIDLWSKGVIRPGYIVSSYFIRLSKN